MKRLLCAIALSVIVAACGGGGGSSGAASGGSAVVPGLATPASVSVVTATNN